MSGHMNAIFISKEDCALITEHFPDEFYRTKL